MRRAAGYIREGRRWVVDMDLEKVFDRAHHDVLMHRVAKRIEDKRVLALIRRFLRLGMMADGIETARTGVVPVRRQLQHLRIQRTRRAADHGRDRGVPR